ncbi:ATP-binding protein [Streptomyces luteoverticillatus]|uniref:ATP-binding protein n=1 Tax=Streptomyces luteoverticillatus TaxID=66425 RepID=A0A3S9PJX9_STRLT|nr:ATP-binding protein [Streptomyces luteoverticillatus]AZQ72617.1 ATP-binding protein [Streptomyces luteoverticillatus]
MTSATLDSQLRTATYHLSAPADATTPRLARKFVTGALEATRHPDLIESALICVSDVVTNVVQHARVNGLSVDVTAYDRHVVIAVCDANAARRPYRRQAADADDEHGRGLMLVEALSHASGVSLVWDALNVIGKSVWFELREGGGLGEDEGGDEQHDENGDRLPPGRAPECAQRYGFPGPRGR